MQSIYYGLQLNKVCRKIKLKYKFQYDINAILSDLIYARVLEPTSKRSSFKLASEFLEKPSYELHDVYRALDILGNECDLIQSELYKNSNFLMNRNDQVLYYDCSNYYFEIEQEAGDKRYGKSKEHRPNPIIQMGLFMDGEGIPLAFSMFPGNANEQTSLKPLEKKILSEFGCQKFIYCCDAGLASEDIRHFNHMGERSFIVTQSIKKLPSEDKVWALDLRGFKRFPIISRLISPEFQKMIRDSIIKMNHTPRNASISGSLSLTHRSTLYTRRPSVPGRWNVRNSC